MLLVRYTIGISFFVILVTGRPNSNMNAHRDGKNGFPVPPNVHRRHDAPVGTPPPGFTLAGDTPAYRPHDGRAFDGRPPDSHPPDGRPPDSRPPVENVEAEAEDEVTFPPGVTIPDDEMSRLINLDVGKYSQMDYAFKYFNDQNHFAVRKDQEISRNTACYEQYFRCTLSQVIPMPVCARGYDVYARGPWKFDAMASFLNFCDMLLHNCRVEARMYYVTFEGYCVPVRNAFHHLDGPPDEPDPYYG